MGSHTPRQESQLLCCCFGSSQLLQKLQKLSQKFTAKINKLTEMTLFVWVGYEVSLQATLLGGERNKQTNISRLVCVVKCVIRSWYVSWHNEDWGVYAFINVWCEFRWHGASSWCHQKFSSQSFCDSHMWFYKLRRLE